jgi:hypothetical protein
MKRLLVTVLLLGLGGCEKESEQSHSFPVDLEVQIEIDGIDGVDEPPLIRNAIISQLGGGEIVDALTSVPILDRYLRLDGVRFSARPYGGSAILVEVRPQPLVVSPTRLDSHAQALLTADIQQRAERRLRELFGRLADRSGSPHSTEARGHPAAGP